MRRLFVIFNLSLFVISVFSVSGQDGKFLDNIKTDPFLSLKSGLLYDLKINDLLNDDLPKLGEQLYGFSIGNDISYKSFLLNSELDLMVRPKGSDHNKSILSRFGCNINLFHKIFDVDANSAYIGFGYSLSGYGVYLFKGTHDIDLNNMTGDDFKGVLQLNNQSHSLVPSILIKHETKDRANIGSVKISYFFNFSENHWRSEHAKLLNSQKESFNHIEISYLFYYFR